MTLIRVSERVGPRHFQVRYGNGVRTQVLNPGQEADLDLVNPDDPVVLGFADIGDITIDGGKAKGGKSEDAEDLRKQIAELQAKLAASQLSEQELRFKLDPTAIENRELAERAGNTPGMADPFPPGTEHESEETDRVREAIGADIVEERRANRREQLHKAAEAAAEAGADLGPGAPGAGTQGAMVLQPEDAGGGGEGQHRHARPRVRATKSKSSKS